MNADFTQVHHVPYPDVRNRGLHTAAFWTSLVFIFTIPFEGAMTVLGIATLTRTIGVAMGFLWLLSLLRRRVVAFHLFSAFVLLFSLWNLASVFWSIDPGRTESRVITFVQLAIMVMIIYDQYTTPSALKYGLQAYVLGVYISMISALMNYFSGASIGDYENRYTGSGLDANTFALILSLSIPVAWHLVADPVLGIRRQVLKVVNLLQIPVALFVITLTASRMGIFTAAAGSLYILIQCIRSRKSFRYPALFALAGAAVVLITFAPETSIERLSTTHLSIAERDLSGRYEVWDEAVSLITEHPVLGIGANAFPIASKDARQVVHNTFLSVLVETGMIGFSLFTLAVVLAVYQVLRTRLDGLWFTLLVIWAIAAFALNLECEKLTWLVLSLVVAAGSMYEKRERSSRLAAH